MRLLATTVYGLVGTDWKRITLARTDSAVLWVQLTKDVPSIVGTMPTMFRTCGDMGNVMAKLGHRVNAACVPAVALPKHTWKDAMTLDQLMEHKFQGPALKANVEALKATYADSI